MEAYKLVMKVNQQVRLGTGWTMVYEVNSVHHLQVKNLHVNNAGNTPVNVWLCVVKPGNNPTEGNALLWNYTLSGNNFVETGKDAIVSPCKMIQAKASTANVCVSVSGDLESVV